jgi:hypothetical protein
MIVMQMKHCTISLIHLNIRFDTDGNIISYPRPLPLYRPKYMTYWEVTSETEETETNVSASHRNDAFPNIRHIFTYI